MHIARQDFRFTQERLCKGSPFCTRFVKEVCADLFTPTRAVQVVHEGVEKLWPVWLECCRFARCHVNADAIVMCSVTGINSWVDAGGNVVGMKNVILTEWVQC